MKLQFEEDLSENLLPNQAPESGQFQIASTFSARPPFLKFLTDRPEDASPQGVRLCRFVLREQFAVAARAII